MKKKILVGILLVCCIILYLVFTKKIKVNLDNDDYINQTFGDKMILGEEEYFYIKQADATIVARIDTGASVSSISAQNIEKYKRLGKTYVAFDLITNDRIIHIEAPYTRDVDIRQSSSEDVQWRPSVELTFTIGNHTRTAEFTLVNRDKLNYPLLIGRNILKDVAVVDVSQSFVQPRTNREGLLILPKEQYEKNKKNNIDVNKKYDEATSKIDSKKAKMAEDSYSYTVYEQE